MRIVIEGFPKIINRFVSWFGTGIDEDTDFGLVEIISTARMIPTTSTHVQHFPYAVEQPPVRIDLLLILGLEDEDNLDRHQVGRIIGLRKNELRRSINGQLGGILVEMS